MNKTLIIAEIGNNHNGCIQRAERLIEAAKFAGADIAKFQLRNLKAVYRDQKNNIEDLGVEYTKEIIKKYEFDKEIHQELKKTCEKYNIEYMCTPWDIKSLDFLLELGVKRIKIASADFDNLELIEAAILSSKELVLSTGMSSTEDIRLVTQFLKSKNANYTLLHCNSTYPAPLHDIQLNYIKSLKEFNAAVGYSGHERGIAVSVAAVALGVSVIERHLTEDKNLEGPDHQASLLPTEFKEMVDMIRDVEIALGPSRITTRALSQGAKLNKENLGKSLIYNKDMRAGEVVKRENLIIKSPGQGISSLTLDKLKSKKLERNVKKNDFVFSSDFVKPSNINLFKNQSNMMWGIPVRPHDVFNLHERFNAQTYEFHISYSDLNRKIPDESWQKLSNKKIIVHAPELFEDSELLDLCAEDLDKKNKSIKNLQRVIDFTSEIGCRIGTDQKVGIVSNVGGFSTHKFRDETEKKYLYEQVASSLQKLDTKNTEILIQNMAPFPLHFGGQRYQNIFCKPEEILNFCENFNVRICLDTAHLSMLCNYFNMNFKEMFNKLLPVTSHFHMSDASGLNGEGVMLGQGDVDFQHVINNVRDDQTFIVETWQGHKALGEGFRIDLKKLEDLYNG